MKTTNEIKEVIREQYSQIALQDKEVNASACCGSGCCSSDVANIMNDEYHHVEGYNPDADLGLGCGLPTQFAQIKKGDVVIDLGSGAGNDVFIARHEVGETGKVIGVDFTPAMIERARHNAEVKGLTNVEFRLGDIEEMPVANDFADVIVSNCVLNLVPNKQAVMKEVFRVLKPGGHFSISDIVLEGDLPQELQQAAEMYAGCVSGAIQKSEYLDTIKQAGFENSTIQKQKGITIPDDILSKYLSPKQLETFKAGNTGIISVTVYADKPIKAKSCCGPECCN